MAITIKNKATLRGTNLAIFAGLFILLFMLFFADILTGSVLIPFKEGIKALLRPALASDTTRIIIFDFRLPKAVTAILTGIALSVSGLQMQTVFRNPLAGPYVLGISAGASLGVAIFALGFSGTMALGLFSVTGTWSLALVAWLGAFMVMLLVLVVSVRVNDNMTILILGILFTSAAAAIVSILQYFSSEALLKSFIVWTMGSLGNVTYSQLTVLVPATIAGTLIALFKSKDLNAFLLGETYARSLGVQIIRSRLVIFFSASLLAGAITAFCGPIGFIGIAVPHLARVIFRTANHLILIPAVVLLGANIMLLSDIIAQLPGIQATLPINSVTALLGIPVVVWMIVKNRKFSAI
jgi:iron complex transport system permease protein